MCRHCTDGGVDVLSANQTRERPPWPHSSEDPTATKQLRARWSAEVYRRFRALKGAVRTGVVERDAFGIGGGENSPGPGTDNPATARDRAASNQLPGPTTPPQDAGINIAPPRPGEFAFPSDRKKIQEFDNWLQEQVDRGILETGRAQRDVAAGTPWQNTYIREAYSKGATHADHALVEQGIIDRDEVVEDVFRNPKHADGVGLIYTRAYRELEGVTDDMGRQISRELAEGLAQGENPRKIARRMNDRIDKVGRHRGRLIARTETIRAHNEAALNRYEDVEGRLDGVTIIAEHSTAMDNRVCPICEALEGRTFKLKEARGRIPVHPQCRCTWVTSRKQDRRRRRVSDRVDEALGDTDRPDTLIIDDIDAAITDELPIESSSLTGLDPRRAAAVARTLDRLDEAGELERSGVRSVGTFSNEMSIARYRWSTDGTRELQFHRTAFNEDHIRENITEGWLVGDVDNPLESTILHEVGHARHFERLAAEATTGDPDDVARKAKNIMRYNVDDDEAAMLSDALSEYAAENPAEAVAEAYLKQSMGEELPEDVARFYESFDGPRVDHGRNLVGNADRYIGVQGERGRMASNRDLPDSLAGERDATRESFEELLAWVEDLDDE